MGHNYRNFYKEKKSENSENKVGKTEVIEEVFEQVMNEIINPVEENNNIVTETKGVVEGCSKLNVREAANVDSNILCVIDKAAEVVIDLENSTEDFYKVCTSSGVEGYCMKKFIEVK